MRDPARLDGFYERIKEIHKENFPDWRIGQFMSNFLAWYVAKYGEWFYTEDARFIEKVEEYVRYIKDVYDKRGE